VSTAESKIFKKTRLATKVWCGIRNRRRRSINYELL